MKRITNVLDLLGQPPGFCGLTAIALILSPVFAQSQPAPAGGLSHGDFVDFTGPDGIVYPDFTFAGVPGGIPDLPVVASLDPAIGQDTLDDYDAFVAGVAAVVAAGGGTLFVPAGTYYLENVVRITEDNVVVRGAGKGLTRIFTGHDSFTNAAFDFVGGGQTTLGFDNYISKPARRGDMQLVMAQHPLQPGDFFQLIVHDVPPDYRGRYELYPPNEADHWYEGLHQVAAVDGDVITLTTPLRVDIPDPTRGYFQIGPFVRRNAHIHGWDLVRGSGLEDLTIETLRNEFANSVQFFSAYGCWVKNVNIILAGIHPINTTNVLNLEIRNVVMDRTWNVGGGGQGYGGLFRSYNSLMENVTTYGMRHAPNLQQHSFGCVVRNSTFNDINGEWHFQWSKENLYENITITHETISMPAILRSPNLGSSIHEPIGPGNVVYNCDLIQENQRGINGIDFGGLHKNWVFAYNRLIIKGGSDGDPAYPIWIGDWCSNLTIAGNHLGISSSGSEDYAIYFSPGFPLGSDGYSSDLPASNENIRIFNNTVTGIGADRIFGGFDTPDINLGNSTSAAYSVPSRPTPPTPSLLEWQLQAKYTGLTTRPLILTQPRSETVAAGTSVTLEVAALGAAPLSYQWRRNGTIIAGANQRSYTIASFQEANEGDYDVLVFNSKGLTPSGLFTLSLPDTLPDLRAEEPFDYDAGGSVADFLSPEGFWLSHQPSADTIEQIRIGSLGFLEGGLLLNGSGNSLTVSGGSVTLQLDTSFTGLLPEFVDEGQLIGASGTTLYLSLVLEGLDVGGVRLADANGEEKLFAGVLSAGSPLVLRRPDGTNMSTGVVATANAHLIVLKIEFKDGDDTVSAFVDPNLSGAEPASPDTTIMGDFRFDRLIVDTLTDPDGLNLDEVRLGTTWFAVTPADIAPALPSPPTATSTEALSFQTIKVTWSGATGSFYGYVIEQSIDGLNWTPRVTVGLVDEWVDGPLDSETTYQYRVRAVGVVGASVPGPLSQATTPAQPPPLDVVYEPFDYELGMSIFTGTVPLGFSGTYFPEPGLSPTQRIADDSLAYRDSLGNVLAVSGNKYEHENLAVQVLMDTSAQGPFGTLLDLAGNIGRSGQTLYISWLIGQSDEPDNFGYLGLAFWRDSSTSSPSSFGLITDFGPTDFRLQLSPLFNAPTGIPTSDNVHLIILKIEYRDGDDRISLYVNPSDLTHEPVVPTSGGQGDFSFDRLRFGKFSAAREFVPMYFDELRFSTSWEKAVPLQSRDSYEGWKLEEFLPLEQFQASIVSRSSDLEPDMVSNFEEYAFLLDPKSVDRPAVRARMITSTDVEVSFVGRYPASDIAFFLDFSETMSAEDWANVWQSGQPGLTVEAIDGVRARFSVVFSKASNMRGFWQVRAEPSP